MNGRKVTRLRPRLRARPRRREFVAVEVPGTLGISKLQKMAECAGLILRAHGSTIRLEERK